MLVLSEQQVQSLLDIDELIDALAQAHVQYSTGKAVMPVRYRRFKDASPACPAF